VGFNLYAFNNGNMIRGDLSDQLIHLTRGHTEGLAMASFNSIVKEKRLVAGNRNIRGGYKCVCFSEAPVLVLSQMVNQSRYAPLGVMINKTSLFKAGGRPVIYQPESEYEALPETLRYRHVRYEPESGTDYTWEREWRLRSDDFDLDPTVVTLVVPRRSFADQFQKEHWNNQRTKAIMMGEDGGWFVEPFPWHFLALEDLGVKVDFS
jgi:hypothetical protein